MKSRQNRDGSIIKLGEWKYFPEFGRFLKDDREEFFIDVRLNKLLGILIKKKGTILRRNEIIESVWNEVQVNEENLTKGIFDLRKLIRERELELEITTIRNIGYRLEFKQNELQNGNTPMMKKVLKSMFYIVIAVLFLVMFIRAIRYEN